MDISRYWILQCINGLGHRQALDLDPIHSFLENYPLADRAERQYQAQLMDIATQSGDNGLWAHMSLRCLVSTVLFFECKEREKQYGAKFQVEATDLFLLVLDQRPLHTDLRDYHPPSAEDSLTTKILEKFDPSRGSLSTFAKWCLRGRYPVKRYLRDHGVIEESDWSLLCQRTPSALQRILRDFSFPTPGSSPEQPGAEAHTTGQFRHSPQEIATAVALLSCFQEVYQQARMQRQTKDRTYTPPTSEQLQVMGKQLHRTQDEVMEDLQGLVQKIRFYLSHLVKQRSRKARLAEPDEVKLWLTAQLKPYLESAITTVVTHRYQYRKRQKKKKALAYAEALQLFFCQSVPMGDIAKQMGVSQPTISRLLDLNTLREDVCREMLMAAPEALLRPLVPDATPEQSDLFKAHLKQFLESMMAAEARQAFTSNNRDICSPFAQFLCQVLSHLES